jgi:hypothetical protein
MKYLGIPIDEKKLAVSQWDPVEEKFEKRLLDGKEICYPLEIG